jgi:gluconolactonase
LKILAASLFLFPALGFLTLGAQTPVPTKPTKTVVLLDPAFEQILSPDAELKKVFPASEGSFLEGPTWVVGRPGHLIFSDIPHNVIYELGPDGKVFVVVDKIFTGDTDPNSRGSNTRPTGLARLTGPDGTAVDKEGRITYVEFSGGRVIRVEKDGTRTVLASQFEGKRFNNPDDLVYKSDGALYFTDLAPRGNAEPRPNYVPFGGVYRVKNGKLDLLSKDYRPNGIAFSPDEKYLYITDEPRKLVRFDVRHDGTLANGHIFVDLGKDPRPGAPDGLKTDRDGNVYTEGPGGVWIFSPVGKHIAELDAPVRQFVNFTFGGDDGKTMYLTSPEAVYSLEFKTSRR